MVIGRICLFIWHGLFILFIIIAYSNKTASWITWTLKPPSVAPPVHTVTWQGSVRQLPCRHLPEVSAAGGPALSVTCLHGAFPTSPWRRVHRKGEAAALSQERVRCWCCGMGRELNVSCHESYSESVSFVGHMLMQREGTWQWKGGSPKSHLNKVFGLLPVSRVSCWWLVQGLWIKLLRIRQLSC